MSSFPGGRGYFSETEKDHPFVSKAVSLAKMVGIVAAGVTIARPLLARYGGTVSKVLLDGARSLNLGGGYGPTVGNFLEFGTSRETRGLYKFATDLRRGVETSKLHTLRAGHIENGLLSYMTDESKDVLAKSPEARTGLKRLVGRYSGYDKPEELERLITTKSHLEQFHKATQKLGIQFKLPEQGRLTGLRDILQDAARGMYDISTTATELDELIGFTSPTLGRANSKQIIQALQHVHQQEQKTTTALGKIFGVDKDRHITWGRITGAKKDVRLAGQLERALQAMGYKAPEDAQGATPFLDATFKTLQDSLSGIFKSDDLALGQARKMLLNSSTGFALDARGELIPFGALNQAGRRLSHLVSQELQVPLLPPFFNIKASALRFLGAEREPILNLGNLQGLSELRRSGALVKMLNEDIYTPSDRTHGLLVGGRLLTIDAHATDVARIEFFDNVKLKAFDTRQSKHIETMAHIRGLDPESYSSMVQDQIEKDGLIQGVTGFIVNRDRHSLSFLDRLVTGSGGGPKWWPFSHQAAYSPAFGFGVEYKNKRMLPLISRFFGDKVTDDPLSRLQFILDHPSLMETLDEVDNQEVNFALHNIVAEGAKISSSISEDLVGLHQAGITRDTWMALPDALRDDFEELLANADNPQALLATIMRSGARTTEWRSMGPTALYGGLNSVLRDPESLLDIGSGEPGRMTSVVNSLFGKTGISGGRQNIEEGLLGMLAQGRGVGKVLELSGGADITQAEQSFLQLAVDINKGASLDMGNPLVAALGRGMTEPQLRAFFQQSTTNVAGQAMLNYRYLGRVGMGLMSNEELLGLGHSDIAKAKLAQILSESLAEIPYGHQAARNLRLLSAIEDANVAGVLQKRFGMLGRAYHPEVAPINPFEVGRYFVTPDSGISFSDALLNPQELLEHMQQTGFGMPDYIQSLVDPEHALGHFSMVTQTLAQMPQRLAEAIGVGLPVQDRYTTARTILSFYGKRILPVVVGFELYKNFNANMHELGLPGLDDVGANTLANVNLFGATLKDLTGLTGVFQNTVGALPGLDQYFHPRTYDEYKEYLYYGDEEVRRNRGWLIGSRSQLTGSDVKYYRPNFYRRWKSHWTELADISNPAHSFLPNLTHPFAPVSNFLNPNWFEWKHRYDRPYIGDGWPGGDWDRATSTYLGVNSDSAYGPLAIGAFGANWPTGMSGGGHPFSTIGGGGSASAPGVQGPGTGGGDGTGTVVGVDGTIYGKAGDPISLQLHKGMSPWRDVRGATPWNAFVSTIDRFRSQTGLYGAMFQMMPFYPDESGAFAKQDSSYVRSFARQMWMGERGELGSLGIVGEFYRRFIPNESMPVDAFNPRSNNQPSWLPERFHRGDPFLRVEGIGELQLPNSAFLATHPWIKPLKMRGSMVGLSEREMVQKWLNPIEPIDSEEGEDIVEFGSATHLGIQRRLRQAGVLMGAEVEVSDQENNISGTIDSIVRGSYGSEILEFKTQGAKSWGQVPEKYKDQLTFYMAQTGIKSSSLVFINRENNQQTRTVEVPWDPNRYQAILNRVQKARQTVLQMVEQGLISPFETYDLIGRLEVLARVAPNSMEYRRHLEFAQQGGLSGLEKKRLNVLEHEAQQLGKTHRLYPHRYGAEITPRPDV